MADRVQVREIDDDEGRRLLRIVRRATGSVVTWRRAQMDHPYLAAGGTTRQLFDALHDQVLALDPCIYEDIRKVRVAFKAETNIVDVVPQATRLLLLVNVPFHELGDPKGMVRDVTNIGRWGVGPAEVGLDSLDNLPYIIGLVRQALERQLGGPEER